MESGVPQTSRGAVSLGEDLSAVIARPSWSIGDYTIALGLLKLGAIVNLYFLAMTLGSGAADPYIVLPALILFAVSAYRCLYPVRYEHDVVFHASFFSSIFVTRLLATFAEVAWIYLFAYVLRLLNLNHVGWVTALSWLMVAQVVISQCFVWTAILTERLELYFYEESGWLLIFTANAIASAYLYLTVGGTLGGKEVLLLLSMLFGVAYLPFESAHLASLRAEMKRNPTSSATASMPILMRLVTGLRRSMMVKNPRTDAASWGGFVGITWMIGYCATLVPLWLYYIVTVLRPH
jgi:hypothetical protein